MIFNLSVSVVSFAAECNLDSSDLSRWKNRDTDPEIRSTLAKCFIHNYLANNSVSHTAVQILKDKSEDLFLREDIVASFGEVDFRKRVIVSGVKAKKLSDQDQAAIDRTVASANDLLAVAQSITEMEEISSVTTYEKEIFRAISQVALDQDNHIILREMAVRTLENALKSVVKSGMYDERLVKISKDTFNRLSIDKDSSLLQVDSSIERLANLGIPSFRAIQSGRAISSIKKKPISE
ncbi:MAG: hypothetical protein M9962_07030 [Oligoflexia bacterium]|nr:hypothetical protein [Oligoflexia bacterium]